MKTLLQIRAQGKRKICSRSFDLFFLHLNLQFSQVWFWKRNWGFFRYFKFICSTLGCLLGVNLTLLSVVLDGEMGEICSSLFSRAVLSKRKVRSTFFYGSPEKSAGASVLACNIYHIGGTVAVPHKYRLTQTGKKKREKLNYNSFLFIWIEKQIILNIQLLFPSFSQYSIFCLYLLLS